MGQTVASVDWHHVLVAEANKQEVYRLPATSVESEQDKSVASKVPTVQASEYASDNEAGLLADVDLCCEVRVWSLCTYGGEQAGDLAFDANTVIVAHPSRFDGGRWYGTTVRDGRVGFFPCAYVRKMEQVQAIAILTYNGSNPDELAFNQGDTLAIVHRTEGEWWKAERNGLVFMVPAAYLELTRGSDQDQRQNVQHSEHPSHGGDNHRRGRATDIYSLSFAHPHTIRRPKTHKLHGSSFLNEVEDDREEVHQMQHRSQGGQDNAVPSVLESAKLVTCLPPDKEDDKGPHSYLSAHDPLNTVIEGGHVIPPPVLSVVTRFKSQSSQRSMCYQRRCPVPILEAAPLLHISSQDFPPLTTIQLAQTDTAPEVANESLDTSDISASRGDEPGEEAAMDVANFKERSDGAVESDDAFERYEKFKTIQALHGYRYDFSLLRLPSTPISASANRMSISSIDTWSLTPTPPQRSPASATPSLREREREDGGSISGRRRSRLLSFLENHTRSSMPDTSQRERKRVVSGPIVRTPANLPAAVPSPFVGGDVGGPTRHENPLFGTCWASLVDRSALEAIPKEECKRQEAIFELISTEVDYVRNVQLIVELFYSRLIEFDEKAAATIFLNIEDILLTNTMFLSSLEERQRDCRLYIDRIGDLLEKHMPNMGVYLNYCVKQADAGKALRHMRETRPALAALLQNLREDPLARNLDLASYLLVPMQRLTRYPLLIRQIMNYTDPLPSSRVDSPSVASSPNYSSEKRSISTALQTTERILEEVNEAIRDREGRDRLEAISSWIRHGKLDLTSPAPHVGPRKLVREGVLSKAKSGRKLRVLLCSDTLILLDEAEKGLYRKPIPVTEIKLKSSKRRRDDALIRLHMSGGCTIRLRATNVQEAKAWRDAILDTGQKALK